MLACPQDESTILRVATRVVRLSEYLAGDDEAMPWIVDDLIPVGGLALLSGRPKAGKSTLARYLSLAAARGDPWLGRDTDPNGITVLCLWLEDSLHGGRAAYRQLDNLDDDPPIWISMDHGVPGDPLDRLRADIEWTHARLAIVDPLVTFLPVADTNDYGKVYATLTPLRDLANETECAILCCHHHRNSNTGEHGVRSMGSTAFTAVVDVTIDLNWEGPGTPRTVTTEQRYGEPIEERALSVIDGIASVGGTKAAAERDAATRKVMAAITNNPGLNTRELRDAAKVKTASMSRLLDDLEESGQIRRERGQRGAIRHYLMGEAA